MESQTGTIETTERVTYDISKVIFPVRHKKCNARLFDGRVKWEEIPVRDAIILIKCWRCSIVLGLRPQMDEIHQSVGVEH